jgi:hypothetical protein
LNEDSFRIAEKEEQKVSMTNASMNEQTKRSGLPGANEDPVDGFDPSIDIKVQDPTLAALKPSDGASWNHCDVPNDYKNRQEG